MSQLAELLDDTYGVAFLPPSIGPDDGMITCSICATVNDEFAVVCVSCKGFLQAKIDNLNLFETIWGLAESPRQTFRKITMAHHKNYGVLLSTLLGMFTVFAILWMRNSGRSFTNVLTLLGSGVILGPFVGVLLAGAVSILVSRLCFFLGGKLSFRNAYAIIAYAAVPVVVSLVVVLPLEVALFGIFLFDRNPSPWVLQPFAYAVLVGLNGIALVWSLVLFVWGISIAAGLRRGRTFVLGLISVVALSMGVYALQHG